MRILVTGGAGYVGSVSVEQLAGAGHEIVVLDTYATARPGANLAGADVVQDTYADRAAVAGLLRAHRIDAVCTAVHARSSANPSASRRSTSARTWPAGSPSSRGCATPVCSAW